jgi:outer membrane murein-binding lipoprotein Lpp
VILHLLIIIPGTGKQKGLANDQMANAFEKFFQKMDSLTSDMSGICLEVANLSKKVNETKTDILLAMITKIAKLEGRIAAMEKSDPLSAEYNEFQLMENKIENLVSQHLLMENKIENHNISQNPLT